MRLEDGAVAVAVPMVVPLIVWLSRTGGLGAVKPGEIRYSRGLRWLGLSLALVPNLGLLTILAFIGRPLRPDEPAAFAGMLLLFGGLGTPLVLEFFRVRHHFDDDGLSFRSPWSRHRRVAWIDVSAVTWRKVMKSLDIKTHGGVKVHISPLLAGLKPFADLALARIPPAVLSANPPARAALQVMSAGAAAELMMSPAPPEELLASVKTRSA